MGSRTTSKALAAQVSKRFSAIRAVNTSFLEFLLCMSTKRVSSLLARLIALPFGENRLGIDSRKSSAEPASGARSTRPEV